MPVRSSAGGGEGPRTGRGTSVGVDEMRERCHHRPVRARDRLVEALGREPGEVVDQRLGRPQVVREQGPYDIGRLRHAADTGARLAGAQFREAIATSMRLEVLPDQLVAGDERVPERDDDVALLLEEGDDTRLLRVEDLLDPGLPVGVPEHASDQVLRPDRALGDGVVADQRAGHAEGADHLGGERVAPPRSEAGVPDSPKNSSSATSPPRAVAMRRLDLGPGAREPLLLVAVGEQPERRRRLIESTSSRRPLPRK